MCLIFIFIFTKHEYGPLSSRHDQLQREGGPCCSSLWSSTSTFQSWWWRATRRSSRFSSRTEFNILHEPEHWHIHDLLHDAMLHALPSRLVTGIRTRGTQFHNVCFDVYRAPCESYDNLSFAASYQERTSNRFGSHSPQKKSGTMRCVLSEFSQGLPVSGLSGSVKKPATVDL